MAGENSCTSGLSLLYFHLYEISVPLFSLLWPYSTWKLSFQINYRDNFSHSFFAVMSSPRLTFWKGALLRWQSKKNKVKNYISLLFFPLSPLPKTPKGKKTIQIIQDRQLHKVLISDPKNAIKAMERFISPGMTAFLSGKKLALSKHRNEWGGLDSHHIMWPV